MSTAAGRVICPRCGENNFSTQANCWKCQSPLGAGIPATTPYAVMPRIPQPASGNVVAVPSPVGTAQRFVDPAVAFWSAIALAFLFPAVAVPVGIIFLMLDDRRKIEIGKITLIWGLVFSLLQTIFFVWVYSEAVHQLKALIPMAGQLSNGGQGAQMPNLNQKVEQLSIPGEQPATENVPFPEPPQAK